MVTLTTPSKKYLMVAPRDWRTIEDYAGWAFFSHPIGYIGLTILNGLYGLFWVIFGIWFLTPVSQFITGFVGRFVIDNLM